MKSPVSAFLLLVCVLAGFAPARPAMADVSEATSQLVTAIMSNNAAQARAAIDSGADVNADTGDGRTPLIVAAMTTRPDIARLLLDRGADPRRQADDPAIGNSVTAALGSQATPADRESVVRALLAAGARTDRKGADGVTPAERARRAGNTQIVSLLAKH